MLYGLQNSFHIFKQLKYNYVLCSITDLLWASLIQLASVPMGNPISKLRKEIDQSEAEKEKMQERLNILEKMVNYHLENAKNEILNGNKNDQ